MFYMQVTPTELASFVLFLFRIYSTVLFWAPINAIWMLQGSNHPVRTFVFRRFLAVLVIFICTNDFVFVYRIQTIPFWAQIEAIQGPIRGPIRHKVIQGSIRPTNAPVYHLFFGILSNFAIIQPLYVRQAYLIDTFCFAMVHRIDLLFLFFFLYFICLNLFSSKSLVQHF